MKISDDRMVGFALGGLNGHAIGTARAFEISPPRRALLPPWGGWD